MSWHYMWIICLADDSHEMSRLVFSEKKNECHLLQILLGALRVKQKEMKNKVWSNDKSTDIQVSLTFCNVVIRCIGRWKNEDEGEIYGNYS